MVALETNPSFADDLTRSLAELDARLAELGKRLDSLAGRLGEGGERSASRGATAVGHLLFVPSPGGYALVGAEGSPPEMGAELELAGRDGLRFGVAKVGPSPLPGDARRCAYLQIV